MYPEIHYRMEEGKEKTVTITGCFGDNPEVVPSGTDRRSFGDPYWRLRVFVGGGRGRMSGSFRPMGNRKGRRKGS